MTKLSVNVNKIATLRNTRTLEIPNIVRLSEIALQAGAHGITIHPRPDQRHIRKYDVTNLAALWKKYPQTEFNIEGNPFIDYLPHIEATRPTQATLVPDDVNAFTSNSGWKLREPGIEAKLRPMIERLKLLGARVSLFMDAEPGDVRLAKQFGADRIELYTEPYAARFAAGDPKAADPFAATARAAADVGLGVNAGHDLNLQNLRPLLQACLQIAEVSIGHALIADALEFGLTETVRRYLAACS